MPDLFPKFDMPDLVEAVEDTSIAYPKSWLFDFDTGDFVLDGAGNVVEADGLTTWAQWCVKAVLTQRLAFVVYNWDYGVDIENVMKQPTRAVTEAELEKEITEALMTDPRTAEVKNFTFEWSGDELTVSFIIVNAAGVPAEIRVGVGYREVMREFSISKVEQTISDWLRGELVNVEPTENGELVIKSVAQPTFIRNSIAYKSDGSQVAENQPRFDVIDGVVGLMIEEGTTNAIPHSSDGKFVYTNVWDRKGYTNDIVEWITDSSVPSPALHVKRITPYPANGGCAYVTVGDLLVGQVMPGEKYTISLWFKGNKQSSSLGAQVRFYWRNSNNELIGSVALPIPFTDNWQRHVFTVTAPDGAYKLTTFQVGLESINLNNTYEFYIAGLQLEQKAYATSWTVGMREAETPTIPTAGVLNPQEGTVEFTVIPQTPHVNPGGDTWFNDFTWRSPGFLIRRGVADGTVNRFQVEIYGTPAGTVRLCYDATFQQGTPYAIAFRWSASGCAFFVDGVKRAETPYLFAAPSATEAQIGYRPYYRQGNALYDDLRISSRARSDEEIAAAYASGQPLPVDEWTTYLLRFDNNLKVGRGGYRRNKIYLQSLGTCQGSHIEWSAEMPANTTAKVYTSLDDVNFTEAVNGAAIEGLSEGVSLSDKALTIKQIMTTEDVSITPKFNRLQYSISGKVYLRG